MEIQCPNCDSFAVYPTGAVLDPGETEYRCSDCGEYFIALSAEE